MRGPFLPPWVLQVAGLLVIAVMVVVKVALHEESVPLLGVGVGLATLGGLGTVNEWIKRAYFKGQPGEPHPGDEERE